MPRHKGQTACCQSDMLALAAISDGNHGMVFSTIAKTPKTGVPFGTAVRYFERFRLWGAFLAEDQPLHVFLAGDP